MSISITEQESDNALKRFYRKCNKNYVFAAKVLLRVDDGPVHLFIAQKAMLFSMQFSLFIMIIASRGFGKTFIMAIYAVLKCLLNPREKVGITGPTYRQSKFVFAEIQRLYAESPVLQESCTREPVIGSDMCILRFKNMSFIMGLPLGDGEKIRGARFNTMLVDEAVKIPQSILELVILPMMSNKKKPMEAVKKAKLRRDAISRGESVEEELGGNQIILCTSAWFKIAYLYKIFSEWKQKMDSGNNQYAVLSFSYLEAPEGFFDLNVVEMTKATVSKIRFAMEWLAYWPSDTDGFFPISLFENARGDFNVQIRGTPRKKYGVSIDPARENDNFIITVGEIGQVSKIVYTESASPIKEAGNSNGWKNLHDAVRRVIRSFNTKGSKVVRISLDAGGGGSIIRDMLSEEYEYDAGDGKAIVEPRILQLEGQNKIHDEIHLSVGGLQILDYKNWSSGWINETAWRLKALLEKRELLFPTPIMSSQDYKHSSAVQVDEEVRSQEKLHRRMIATDIRDIIMEDIEETIYECSNIIAKPLPSQPDKYTFSTPKTSLKKDRWAALMLFADAVYCLRQNESIPKREIAQKGVVTNAVLGMTPDHEVDTIRGDLSAFKKLEEEENQLDAILEANQTYSGNISFGNLAFNADAAALTKLEDVS